jgi:MFS family permease
MTVASPRQTEETAAPPAVKSAERRAFGVALGAHALHDGYTDLVYVMLPIWQAEFGIGYAAVALLRALLSGTMAVFQIPAGLLAERIGIAALLGTGTGLIGLCYCLVGLSGGLASLIAALFIGGLGLSTQHPLASALVARAFSGNRLRTALGTYNFAGDVGKMALPAAAALLISAMPWRNALALLGALGLAAAVAIFTLTPRLSGEHAAAPVSIAAAAAGGIRRRGAFALLLSMGVLDSATRMAFLTFLPFLLTMKGASLPIIGFSLTLVFLGGAAGKLVCAWLGTRIGVLATVCLTEGMTAAGILALLPLPLEFGMALLPVIGVALNGTSSVLYGSVPELVAPEKRARAFGIFYTGTIGSGAIAPILYGFLGDAVGVPTTLIVIALVVLLTLPLAVLVNPALHQGR